MPSNNDILQKAVTVGQLQMAYDDAALHPVDVNSLTPSYTFQKNAIIGINGVIYRATKATQNFPVPLSVSGSAFVVNTTASGRIAFVCTSATVNSDWEQWTDAAIEYWKETLEAAITAKATVADVLAAEITYNGVQYTVQNLLTEVAKLYAKTVVVSG